MKNSYRTSKLISAVTLLSGVVLLAACSGAPGGDASIEFPQGNIEITIPFDAGGSTDLSARTLASEMESTLETSIVAVNRAGASGSLGMEHLAKQSPDGYSIGILTVEAAMLGHQGFNVSPEDYDILGQVVTQTAAVSVPTSSPYSSLEELLAAAKAAPNSITVANSGPGANWDAVTAALGDAAGVEFKHVPFDGGAPAVTAAIGAQVDAVISGISEVSQPHSDGQLRVLALLDEDRSPRLPDVPTAKESGTDVVMGSWHIIAAPKGLDPETKAILVNAVKQAQESETFRTIINDSGNTPFYRTPEEAADFLQEEYERFADFYATQSES